MMCYTVITDDNGLLNKTRGAIRMHGQTTTKRIMTTYLWVLLMLAVVSLSTCVAVAATKNETPNKKLRIQFPQQQQSRRIDEVVPTDDEGSSEVQVSFTLFPEPNSPPTKAPTVVSTPISTYKPTRPRTRRPTPGPTSPPVLQQLLQNPTTPSTPNPTFAQATISPTVKPTIKQTSNPTDRPLWPLWPTSVFESPTANNEQTVVPTVIELSPTDLPNNTTTTASTNNSTATSTSTAPEEFTAITTAPTSISPSSSVSVSTEAPTIENSEPLETPITENPQTTTTMAPTNAPTTTTTAEASGSSTLELTFLPDSTTTTTTTTAIPSESFDVVTSLDHNDDADNNTVISDVLNIKNKSSFTTSLSVWSATLDFSNLEERAMRAIHKIFCNPRSSSSSSSNDNACILEGGILDLLMDHDSNSNNNNTNNINNEGRNLESSMLNVSDTILSFEMYSAIEMYLEENGTTISWSQFSVSCLVVRLGAPVIENILQDYGSSSVSSAAAAEEVYEDGVRRLEDFIEQEMSVNILDGTFDHLMNLVTSGGTLAVSSISGQEKETFSAFATTASTASATEITVHETTRVNEDGKNSEMYIGLFFAGLGVGLIIVVALIWSWCRPQMAEMVMKKSIKGLEVDDTCRESSSSPAGIDTVYVIRGDGPVLSLDGDDESDDNDNERYAAENAGQEEEVGEEDEEEEEEQEEGEESELRTQASRMDSTAGWSIAGMDVEWAV